MGFSFKVLLQIFHSLHKLGSQYIEFDRALEHIQKLSIQVVIAGIK